LRLDLRGHGESINLGRFVPGEQPRSPMIWDAEVDVWAAHQYLQAQARLDGERIGIVGGSYSGEEMAEAGRLQGYARAYVALSPGSFSDESIQGLDASGVSWLFVASKDERFLREITASVQAESQTVELLIVPGTRHASDILEEHPEMAERIAVWLAEALR
jgi:dienelactone hydrolase